MSSSEISSSSDNSKNELCPCSANTSIKPEDRVPCLERALSQTRNTLKAKESVVKMQKQQLKKLEDMYKKCLEENDALSYANKKTMDDLENLRIINKQYEGKIVNTSNHSSRNDISDINESSNRSSKDSGHMVNKHSIHGSTDGEVCICSADCNDECTKANDCVEEIVIAEVMPNSNSIGDGHESRTQNVELNDSSSTKNNENFVESNDNDEELCECPHLKPEEKSEESPQVRSDQRSNSNSPRSSKNESLDQDLNAEQTEETNSNPSEESNSKDKESITQSPKLNSLDESNKIESATVDLESCICPNTSCSRKPASIKSNSPNEGSVKSGSLNNNSHESSKKGSDNSSGSGKVVENPSVITEELPATNSNEKRNSCACPIKKPDANLQSKSQIENVDEKLNVDHELNVDAENRSVLSEKIDEVDPIVTKKSCACSNKNRDGSQKSKSVDSSNESNKASAEIIDELQANASVDSSKKSSQGSTDSKLVDEQSVGKSSVNASNEMEDKTSVGRSNEGSINSKLATSESVGDDEIADLNACLAKDKKRKCACSSKEINKSQSLIVGDQQSVTSSKKGSVSSSVKGSPKKESISSKSNSAKEGNGSLLGDEMKSIHSSVKSSESPKSNNNVETVAQSSRCGCAVGPMQETELSNDKILVEPVSQQDRQTDPDIIDNEVGSLKTNSVESDNVPEETINSVNEKKDCSCHVKSCKQNMNADGTHSPKSQNSAKSNSLNSSKKGSLDGSENHSQDSSKKGSLNGSENPSHASQDSSKKGSLNGSEKQSQDSSKKGSLNESKHKSQDLSNNSHKNGGSEIEIKKTGKGCGCAISSSVKSSSLTPDVIKEESQDLSKKGSLNGSKLESQDSSKKGSLNGSKHESQDSSMKGSLNESKHESQDSSKKGSLNGSKHGSQDSSNNSHKNIGSENELKKTGKGCGCALSSSVKSSSLTPDVIKEESQDSSKKGSLNGSKHESQDSSKKGSLNGSKHESQDSSKKGSLNSSKHGSQDSSKNSHKNSGNENEMKKTGKGCGCAISNSVKSSSLTPDESIKSSSKTKSITSSDASPKSKSTINADASPIGEENSPKDSKVSSTTSTLKAGLAANVTCVKNIKIVLESQNSKLETILTLLRAQGASSNFEELRDEIQVLKNMLHSNKETEDNSKYSQLEELNQTLEIEILDLREQLQKSQKGMEDLGMILINDITHRSSDIARNIKSKFDNKCYVSEDAELIASKIEHFLQEVAALHSINPRENPEVVDNVRSDLLIDGKLNIFSLETKVKELDRAGDEILTQIRTYNNELEEIKMCLLKKAEGLKSKVDKMTPRDLVYDDHPEDKKHKKSCNACFKDEQSYVDEIAQLKQELAKKKEEIRAIHGVGCEAIPEYEKEIENLRTQLKLLRNELDEYKKEVGRGKEKSQSIFIEKDDQLKKSNLELGLLNEEFSKVNEEYTKLLEDYDKSQAEIQRLNDQIMEFSDKHKEKDSAICKFKDTFKDLTEELKNVMATKCACEELRLILKQNEEKMLELQKVNDQLETELEGFKGKLTKANETSEYFNEKLEEALCDCDKYKAQIHEAKNSNAKLKATCCKLEEIAEQHRKAKDSYKREFCEYVKNCPSKLPTSTCNIQSRRRISNKVLMDSMCCENTRKSNVAQPDLQRIIAECEQYKSKLDKISLKIQRHAKEHAEYRQEAENKIVALTNENEKLKRQVMDEGCPIIRGMKCCDNVNIQLCELRAFVTAADAHLEQIVTAKLKAKEILEKLTYKTSSVCQYVCNYDTISMGTSTRKKESKNEDISLRMSFEVENEKSKNVFPSTQMLMTNTSSLENPFVGDAVTMTEEVDEIKDYLKCVKCSKCPEKSECTVSKEQKTKDSSAGKE
ncbi:PREDICTED: serine-rich adhesin for platelets-like [Nicrophorus vespilloides]|uniref:Serine-rich adhesin for platelets-like n=1 Tax=Nicrophorus vespilloides TaxID=110193 RepID=A0ABM1NFL4_NICVS|nr:PREDICTED: serine-rich adhesin for platelets-like [Nicrophorus vespilloides]